MCGELDNRSYERGVSSSHRRIYHPGTGELLLTKPDESALANLMLFDPRIKYFPTPQYLIEKWQAAASVTELRQDRIAGESTASHFNDIMHVFVPTLQRYLHDISQLKWYFLHGCAAIFEGNTLVEDFGAKGFELFGVKEIVQNGAHPSEKDLCHHHFFNVDWADGIMTPATIQRLIDDCFGYGLTDVYSYAWLMEDLNLKRLIVPMLILYHPQAMINQIPLTMNREVQTNVKPEYGSQAIHQVWIFDSPNF